MDHGRSILLKLFMVIPGHAHAELQSTSRFPAEVQQSSDLPSCYNMSFLQYIWCHIFCIFVPWAILLFKMDPVHTAEVLSSVPKHKKAGKKSLRHEFTVFWQ